MMVEIFKYTERVVNMIRPRKLLFMAIGGLLVQPNSFRTLMASRRRSCPQSEDEPATLPAIPLCPGGT